MITNGRCDCGRRGCPCTRLDCDHGWLPDEDRVDARGRAHTVSPACPECRPELVQIIAEHSDPDDRASALRERSILKGRGRRSTPRQRRGAPSTAWAEAAAEREAARADLR